MNFIQRFKIAWKNAATSTVSGYTDEKLLEWLGISTESTKATSEATYYTCLKRLSETMGMLPLKYYQQTEKGRIRADPTNVTRLMTLRPNPYVTPSTMWSTMMLNKQHYGNAYIWLRRFYYKGKYHIADMWNMQSDCVQVIRDDAGIFGYTGGLYYQYSDPVTGKQYMFRNGDVLHFKTWFTFDGIMGAPVRTILKALVDGSGASQQYMNALYSNGLTSTSVLQYTGDLDDKRQTALVDKYMNAFAGPKNAGKMIPVPTGITITPMKMSNVDAQFFELKKYSALQIAAAFGINPNQINDYEKSSYSSSEAMTLDFLVSGMTYSLKSDEEEINAKVQSLDEINANYFYKFNEKAVLRMTAKDQMQVLKDGVNNAIYTPNEARDYLDKPAATGGDVLMCNGNYIPITQVGSQYNKTAQGTNAQEGGNADGGN